MNFYGPSKGNNSRFRLISYCESCGYRTSTPPRLTISQNADRPKPNWPKIFSLIKPKPNLHLRQSLRAADCDSWTARRTGGLAHCIGNRCWSRLTAVVLARDGFDYRFKALKRFAGWSRPTPDVWGRLSNGCRVARVGYCRSEHWPVTGGEGFNRRAACRPRWICSRKSITANRIISMERRDFIRNYGVSSSRTLRTTPQEIPWNIPCPPYQ